MDFLTVSYIYVTLSCLALLCLLIISRGLIFFQKALLVDKFSLGGSYFRRGLLLEVI